MTEQVFNNLAGDEINQILAAYADIPTEQILYRFRWFGRQSPGWATREAAEARRLEMSEGGFACGEVEAYQHPQILPHYSESLDALDGVRERLLKTEEDWLLYQEKLQDLLQTVFTHELLQASVGQQCLALINYCESRWPSLPTPPLPSTAATTAA